MIPMIRGYRHLHEFVAEQGVEEVCTALASEELEGFIYNHQTGDLQKVACQRWRSELGRAWLTLGPEERGEEFLLVKLPSKTGKRAPEEKGGRPMSALWPEWVAELASLVHENGYPEGQGTKGMEELISNVEERLAARNLEAPARATVQATAQAVLRRYRSAQS